MSRTAGRCIQNVANAGDKVDEQGEDLNNAEGQGAYDVEMAKVEGDRKVALNKLKRSAAIAEDCKASRMALSAAKSRLKAMLNPRSSK